MKIIRGLLFFFILVAISACTSEDGTDPEPTKKNPPIISWENNEKEFILKEGSSITLQPFIENGENATYEWFVNEKTDGTKNKYMFFADQAGVFFIKIKIKTSAGEAVDEIKITVRPDAPPIITFALLGDGINVRANTEYLFAPDITNAEDATYEWLLDGTIVSTDSLYTFKQSDNKTYTLRLTVKNKDGQDSRTLYINIVDNLPLEVFFDKPTLFAENTDRYVFSDRSIYLQPMVNGADNPSFEWYVNDVLQVGTSGSIFKYTPSSRNECEVKVIVSEASSLKKAEVITRTITSLKSGVSASVIVFKQGTESGSYRTFSGGSLFANKVYEYVPAPGQFINEYKDGSTTNITTLREANAYAESRMKNQDYVSLGGFGGYIVVGFDHSIRNLGNYQGYDFAVQGNQFKGSSEPGIVWVMQDVNGNGLPDDTWYELKGSEYGKAETKQNYAVTYYRPQKPQMNVSWSDNKNGSGTIDYLGQWHSQDYYYPAWVSTDSYTLRGTCLKARNSQSGGIWNNGEYNWGYADNWGTDRLTTEENPNALAANVYFKICNAVNLDGSAANLQYVDFIKIQTGVNAKSGWLGEISTEVFSFTDMNQ